ncbi:MAG: hypothetical protein K2M76_06125, partial [Muribaculaceae bacterium]|nr:hypothetical protein [Muribaculaceae bacterium]
IYVGQRYLSCNGRLGDLLWPTVTFMLPLWLRTALCGAAVAAFFGLAVYCSRSAGGARHRVAAQIMLIAILTFVMPWWDYMLLYVCQFGYVWAAMFGLWFLRTYFSRWGGAADRSVEGLMASLLLGGVTGGMHEAVGLPLVCGMTWYVFACGGRRSLTARRVWMLAGLVAGCAFVLASPALWHRLGAGHEPDDSLYILLLKNTSATVLLFVCLLVSLLRNRWRSALWSRLCGAWGVWVVAALAGMCISVVSGIVGRPGWFSQTCALVALWQWAGYVGLRWPSRYMAAVVSVVLWLAVAVVSVTFAVWQRRLGLEAVHVTDMYVNSADGQVYFDATPDDAAPWFTFGRCRGVPDADDSYLLEQFELYYGDEFKPLRVLPASLVGSARPDTCSLPEGVRVLAELPGDAELREANSSAIMLCRTGGRDYTLVPFRAGDCTYYLMEPRVIDPGDR